MTKITLDRVALRALVEADPEFELELKAAVLSEIAKRFYEKDAAKMIEAAEPALFKAALKALQESKDVATQVAEALTARLVEPNRYSYHPKLSPALKKQIDEMTEIEIAKVTAQAQVRIQAAYSTAIEAAVEAKLSDPLVDDRISKRVERLADEEINRRVAVAVEAKLAAIRAAV